ncbi:hypothetical protein Tco_1012440 [Tanacetum coccineum]
MTERGKNKDITKYCYCHENHGHEMNYCRELKNRTEEAVRSRQLAHLAKGIKKGKGKAVETQIGEWKKGDKETTLVEDPIFIIQRSDPNIKRKIAKHELYRVGEITFPIFINKVLCTQAIMREESKTLARRLRKAPKAFKGDTQLFRRRGKNDDQ